ncbi:MAG: TRAP transporter small permease subunit [Planctomycetota bacterium]
MPPSRLLRFALGVDRWNARIARVTAWLMLLLVSVGAYNAIARSMERYCEVRLSSNALLELQWYLFGIAFLLGAPYALQRGDHVRVDVLYSGLPRRGRLWIDVFGGILFLIPFCLAAIWLSLEFVADSFANGEWSNDPGGLPRWPIKPIIPIAFALLLLQGISEVVKRLAVLRGTAQPEQVGLAALGKDTGDER